MSKELNVPLRIRPLIAFLLTAIAALLVLHLLSLGWLASNDFELDRWSWLFHLRYEDNVPSLFSFSLLMLNSLILLLIGYAESTGHNRFVLHWIGLGAVFCFLALDEALGFHEALGEALQGWRTPRAYFISPG